MIQFAYTILYVKDVSRSLSFYEQAFGFQRRFLAPGEEYGELDTGNTILSFAAHSLADKNLSNGYIQSSPKAKPFGIEIGFTTAEVEKVYTAAVKAGATEVEEAKTKPWGQVVAYVKDPDGFLIEICTPMA